MAANRNDEQERLWMNWFYAQAAAERGDLGPLVTLLRSLHHSDKVPDLSFIADLLEKKPRVRGRPRGDKIARGLKQYEAARAVAKELSTGRISVEKAIAQVAKTIHMSESIVKQHYYNGLRAGIVRPPPTPRRTPASK